MESNFTAGARESANEAASGLKKVTMLFFAASLGSFLMFVFRVIWDGGLKAFMSGSPVEAEWGPLVAEKKMYLAHGYDLSWMNLAILEDVREMAYPFFQFWDLFLLRLYGLWQMIPFVAVLGLLAVFEGRIAYGKKKEQFANISSTRYHLFGRMTVLVGAIASIFLAFPFGDTLPYIGTVPVYVSFSVLALDFHIWLSNPVNLMTILALPVVLICYQVSSNFSRNI